MMQKLSIVLLVALAAASTADQTNLRSRQLAHQHRELNGFTDAFTGGWYIFLNSLGVPCPPHSTEDHPLGHCAHHSHHEGGGLLGHFHHHHHKSGGGGGGSHSSGGSSSGGSSGGESGGSSGCTDECEEGDENCTPCEEVEEGATDCECEEGDEDCQKACDCECEEGDDDCLKECEGEAAIWQDDGHTDDSTDDMWQDDGHTDDSTDDNAWGNDGWSSGYAFNSAKSSNYSAGGNGNSNGKVWGIAALVAGLVGIAVFVGLKKRKRSDEEDRNVPDDVYVEGVSVMPDQDGARSVPPGEYEMKSVRSGTSRAQTIKSAISRSAGSFKSKFSRKRSGNVMAQEPLAPAVEGGFEDETIATNDQEGGVMM